MVAVRLLGRVRSALGVELPLASLLAGGSVEALAAAVRAAREGGQAAGTGDLVEIQPAAGADSRRSSWSTRSAAACSPTPAWRGRWGPGGRSGASRRRARRSSRR